jgi:predicted  nucleic acid-binding Zn-ribbon protein
MRYHASMSEADFSLTVSIVKEIRAELREHRTMLLQLIDASRRHDRRLEEVERRIADTRDELELVLKGELLGRLGHFETRIDEKLAQLADRVQALEGAKS